MAAGGNALHDNMSPTRRRRRPLRLHWTVALMPPPSPQVETGRRTRHRRCPPRLPRSFFSLDAPPPLSMRRRLSRCAAASIATPTPVSLRLSRASGWLLHRHLSRRASASLVMPAPLSLHRHLSRCAAASLVAPHLRRLVVASPTILTCLRILTCRRLSCRAGWLLPRYLSLCAAVSQPQ